MASNSPFLIAHYEKQALTKQTAKRVQLLYKQSAQDIERKLRNLTMLAPSDSLKKVYLENLLKDINKSSDSFNRLVQSTVLDAGETSGKLAVEAGNKAMQNAGLGIKGAYSYIPRQQVENIASGKLYGDKWSLSKSIWKNGLRTKSDIEKVVAKGLMENKSIKDIADDLTKYVDPTARKPWDWSKVYPGTAQQVDYNAQRLARTMIQHSFQASLVQSQLYNPFCKGVIWYSVGIHGRTCELCMERDGQVFPVKDLPLDHPNGLCYFEPALDSMDAIADRLADWTNGVADPGLDTYVAKAFGLDPKSLAGKNAVETAKQSTARNIVRPNRRLKQKHKVVEGKDISTTWVRRSGKFDFEIEDVINAQGFDGKPRVVSAKEFDAAVKDSKFIAQRTYSAESQEILEAYRKQLYEGQWYVDCGTGGAQYGQGMYCAADYTGTLSEGILEEMEHYQDLGRSRGFPFSYTETMTLDPSAKIVTYDDLLKEFSEYGVQYASEKIKQRAIDEVLKGDKDLERLHYLYERAATKREFKEYEALKSKLKVDISKLDKEITKHYNKMREGYISDIGSYAASKGYDAINAVGHGASESYTVILNRTKVIIKQP